jgi:hypothetical protein
MKAIRVHELGGPDVLRYEDVIVPEPGARQAVVKVEAIGLNFVDCNYRKGAYKTALPFTPGMEAAGTVAIVGPEVTEIRVGDRVAYAPHMGAYAEYALVPVERLVKVPDGLDARSAAAAILQGMTAHYLPGARGGRRRWAAAPAPPSGGAAHALDDGNPPGGRKRRAPRLPPRRVHVPGQPPDLMLPGEAVLPPRPARSGHGPGAVGCGTPKKPRRQKNLGLLESSGTAPRCLRLHGSQQGSGEPGGRLEEDAGPARPSPALQGGALGGGQDNREGNLDSGGGRRTGTYTPPGRLSPYF